MDKSGEDTAVADVATRLVAVHPEIPAEQIHADIRREHATFAHAAVRDFISLLVERRLVERYGRRGRACVNGERR